MSTQAWRAKTKPAQNAKADDDLFILPPRCETIGMVRAA
jgi:hypothetical protein